MAATAVDRRPASSERPPAGPLPGDPAATPGGRPGRRGVSLATRLAVAVVGVAVVALVAGTAVVLTGVTELAEGVRRDALQSLLAHQTDTVERFVLNRRDAVAALAGIPAVAEAAASLAAAYSELEPTAERVSEATDRLEDRYAEVLVPPLEAVSGEAIRAESLLPVDDPARVLQDDYVLPVLGMPSAERVDDAGDGSAYSAAHAEVSPQLEVLAERLGLADLYLIDAATGRIVYSVGKSPDFATSLEVGPYSGTQLARVVGSVLERPEDGVQITDLAPYAAYGGQPAGFVAAPLGGAGGASAAVLAGAYRTAGIDAILTAGEQWEQFGFGETGQTFLVGPDGRMRSIGRELVENPDLYLSAVASSTSAEERTAMAAVGTTATFQRALSEDDIGDTGPGEPFSMTNHRGEPVLAVFEPVELPFAAAAPDWRVVGQIAEDEIAGPLDALRRRTFAAVTVGVLLATFFAVWWARRVFRPVRSVGERLRRVRRGEPDPPVRLSRDTPAELSELHARVGQLIDALDRQQREVGEAQARRRETIRAILPAAVAERFMSGDRRVVDEVAQASVVVLVTDGLGELIEAAADGGRELLGRVVHELDEVAGHHGLGRVKLVGHSYFAACGLERPYLDHARRAVLFAAAARETVRALTAGAPASLAVAAGVASGPVTVGLAGSALMVYEAWGETVDHARALAQRAVSDEILISPRTSDILPPDIVVATRPSPDGPVRIVSDVPTDAAVTP